jgi:hypothetical protein
LDRGGGASEAFFWRIYRHCIWVFSSLLYRDSKKKLTTNVVILTRHTDDQNNKTSLKLFLFTFQETCICNLKKNSSS